MSLADPSLLGGNNAIRPNLVGTLNVPLGPTSGGTNPNKIPNSGLAQTLVGQFGNLGRNVLRVNPLIQSDMAVGRVFKIRERMSFKIQAQVFNVFNNVTFSTAGATFSLSAPSTFGYYTGTDTNSRRIALTGRLIW